MEKKIKKLITATRKGEFDLIKALKWKQKLFNGEKVYSKEWSAPTKDWHEGMNFGFEQALSLVYNWFNPDWYNQKERKKKALK